MGATALVDLASGTVAGAAQLLVGHPFDTIKVKLQCQPKPEPGQAPKYSGALDATRKVLATHGPRGLFKGLSAPLGTVALFNAVLFTVRGKMEQLLAHPDGSPLTVGDQAVAGLGAGFAVSFLACPTELIKCRLQAQSGKLPVRAPALATSPALATAGAATFAAGGSAAVAVGQAASMPGGALRYVSPADVVRQVVLHEGGPLGLLRGLAPTLLREVPGNAAMFACYEAVKLGLVRQQGLTSPRELGSAAMVTAGGLAGATYWLAVYPVDVIKSKLQIDSYSSPAYRGVLDCARKVYASEGLAGLFRGFSPAMARSVPANAACFLVYEYTRTALAG